MTETKIEKIDKTNCLESFTYYNPTKVIYGKNTILKIGNEIKKFNINKIMLVCGGGSIRNNGVYDQTIQSLNDNNIDFIEFWGIRANPILTKVEEGIKLAKDNNVDGILSVGGGSCLDSAKAIAGGVCMKEGSIWDAYEHMQDNTKGKPLTGNLPIFCILTISATGSEMNAGAVVTNETLMKKWPLMVEHPKVSIVDPTVQYSLPWKQVACGAVDAIVHCLEHVFMYIDQEMTMSILEGIMKTIIKCTDKIKENNNDYPSRANLCYAATLALNGMQGVAMTGDWATHFLEHCVSAIRPNVPHGEGLAVIIPSWILNIAAPNNPIACSRFAHNVFGVETIEEAMNLMKQKFISWDLASNLRELDINENDLEHLIEVTKLWPSIGKLKVLDENDFNIIYRDCL